MPWFRPATSWKSIPSFWPFSLHPLHLRPPKSLKASPSLERENCKISTSLSVTSLVEQSPKLLSSVVSCVSMAIGEISNGSHQPIPSACSWSSSVRVQLPPSDSLPNIHDGVDNSSWASSLSWLSSNMFSLLQTATSQIWPEGEREKKIPKISTNPDLITENVVKETNPKTSTFFLPTQYFFPISRNKTLEFNRKENEVKMLFIKREKITSTKKNSTRHDVAFAIPISSHFVSLPKDDGPRVFQHTT